MGFAVLTGGGLMSLSILSLFRHKAGVGGVNILALYLQDNFNIRAGYFQLDVEAVILVAAFFVLPLDRALYSILGALVLNFIIGRIVACIHDVVDIEREHVGSQLVAIGHFTVGRAIERIGLAALLGAEFDWPGQRIA